MENEVFQKQVHPNRILDAGDFPKVVLIDTVSLCNLRCSMCVHKEMKRKKGIMAWGLFRKIIDEIASSCKNTRVWMVFFGEALILKKRKPTLFDMIAYAKDRGLTDVVLNSNACLLDSEAAKGLIDSGLDAIYIGVDAFLPETYAKIRVGANLQKTVNNIIGLITLKQKRGIRNPEVFVQFVEMDINKDEKEDFIAFWKKQGVIVKVRPKISWAGAIDASNLVLDNKDRWPCHWAMQTMSINDSGKVVTCAVDLDAHFIAGDVNYQFLKDIWNGKLRELRRFHAGKEFEKLPLFCRNCRDWQSAQADYY